ncbi:unnamed protein product [Protopolystoma xenopodis]|uniref:Uncharacterized protein n=1 Tax=Protopolystoma xenopodis TaxID=117903 RepID=A0A448XRK3_9PLAT|nr:unnamed protein product [Protopolystoma xenopodis]
MRAGKRQADQQLVDRMFGRAVQKGRFLLRTAENCVLNVRPDPVNRHWVDLARLSDKRQTPRRWIGETKVEEPQ